MNKREYYLSRCFCPCPVRVRTGQKPDRGCSILRVYAAAWNGKRKSLMLRFMGSTGSDTWTSRRVALVADADGVRPYTAEDLQALKECETV